MIKVNEIFYSIQGESSLAGLPTLFIRTSGCHLRCSYCDTTYAYHKGENYSLERLIKKVRESGAKYICITGGEPLLQKEVFELAERLCNLNYFVSIETSGDKSGENVDKRVKKIFDVKTPGSGIDYEFHKNNLPKYIGPEDVKSEYKFVICSKKDFDWSHDFCKKHGLFKNNAVLFSPSHNELSASWLAEKIIKEKSLARLQLQLHKYIWSNNKPGV